MKNNNLKNVRQKAGLTQEQLANAIGSSKSYISQLECGARDIDGIRQSTMSKICAILNCDPNDLYISVDFEYDEDGKLIVDGAWNVPSLREATLIDIKGSKFLLRQYPTGNFTGKDVAQKLEPWKNKNIPGFSNPVSDFVYPLMGCVPRNGFNIKLGRAITKEEFLEFCQKYGIGKDDISNVFVGQKGGFYGEKHKKTFLCVQVRLNSSFNPVKVESELKSKSIEASNVEEGIINIRVPSKDF